MIKNRLEKNLKKLRPWAQRQNNEAYRLYDRDIPEFPYIVDIYKDIFVIFDRTDKFIDEEKNHLPLLVAALKQIFNATDHQLVFKKRERQEGHSQYQRLGDSKSRFTVQEGSWKFWVNPYDYLDTGLFLDHRPLRYKISTLAKGKSFLNLFCYTGSFSVAAAQGGAITTSLDMSNTYLEWAMENFTLNNLSEKNHRFIQSDAVEFLEGPVKERFDLIFLDPPTFSKSKRMAGTFEVERDQNFLIHSTMARLNPGGELYFSNNKRTFKMEPELLQRYSVKDISLDTIPPDFHDKKIHQVFVIKNNL